MKSGKEKQSSRSNFVSSRQEGPNGDGRRGRPDFFFALGEALVGEALYLKELREKRTDGTEKKAQQPTPVKSIEKEVLEEPLALERDLLRCASW